MKIKCSSNILQLLEITFSFRRIALMMLLNEIITLNCVLIIAFSLLSRCECECVGRLRMVATIERGAKVESVELDLMDDVSTHFRRTYLKWNGHGESIFRTTGGLSKIDVEAKWCGDESKPTLSEGFKMDRNSNHFPLKAAVDSCSLMDPGRHPATSWSERLYDETHFILGAIKQNELFIITKHIRTEQKKKNRAIIFLITIFIWFADLGPFGSAFTPRSNIPTASNYPHTFSQSLNPITSIPTKNESWNTNILFI